jgi:hypothetical protein
VHPLQDQEAQQQRDLRQFQKVTRSGELGEEFLACGLRPPTDFGGIEVGALQTGQSTGVPDPGEPLLLRRREVRQLANLPAGVLEPQATEAMRPAC